MMKHTLIHITLAVAALALLPACSDDPANPYDHTPALRIVSSDVIFPGGASSGDVVVEADGPVAAQTASPWLQATVEGNTVHVAVEANNLYDGRSAVLTLTSGADRLDVIVQQAGLLFTDESERQFITGDAAGERRFRMSATTTIDLSATAPWLHGRFDGDSLVVATDANTTGRVRSGYLHYTCGPTTDSIRVVQGSYADLMRRYYLAGYLNAADGQPTSDIVELTLDDKGQPVLAFPTFGWQWPAEFDESTLTLRLSAGQCIGQFTPDGETAPRYVGTVMWDVSRDAIIYAKAVTMSAAFDVDDRLGTVAARLADNGSWAGSTCDAVRFELFRSRSIVMANRLGQSVFALVGPFLAEYE